MTGIFAKKGDSKNCPLIPLNNNFVNDSILSYLLAVLSYMEKGGGKTRLLKIFDLNTHKCIWESMVGFVIQATGTVGFEDGFMTGVLLGCCCAIVVTALSPGSILNPS